MPLSAKLKQRVQAAMRNAVQKLAQSKSQEVCSCCQNVYPAWMVCDGSVIERLDVVCLVCPPFSIDVTKPTLSLLMFSLAQTCLNSPELQAMLDRARNSGGKCPLCYQNSLLASPFEYEVAKEPLRSAKELIALGLVYGVSMQGLHDASVSSLDWSCDGRTFRNRPSPTMPPVREALFKSSKGTLSEAWYKGEQSFLSK